MDLEYWDKAIAETIYGTYRDKLDYDTSFIVAECPQCGDGIRLSRIDDEGTSYEYEYCEGCNLYYTYEGKLYSVVRQRIQPQIESGYYMIYDDDIYLVKPNYKSMSLLKRFKEIVK